MMARGEVPLSLMRLSAILALVERRARTLREDIPLAEAKARAAYEAMVALVPIVEGLAEEARQIRREKRKGRRRPAPLE